MNEGTKGKRLECKGGPCAHCARRATRTAERCDIRMFRMFDIVSHC